MTNNNNKRDVEDEENNSIIKKQKFDTNNNDSTIGDNDSNNDTNSSNSEIDIINLEKHTVAQLRVISTSLGISIKSGIKKSEIIEKIKITNKTKQDILSKQEYDKNINSFNKHPVEFKIKEGVDESEWLFWKIFRNKPIFRRIMSFMEKILDYNSIISVTKMLNSNQYGMIRDKVVNGGYLTFDHILVGKGDVYISEINEIFSIFNKDNDQDRLFYKQLFKNYGGYIFNFNTILVGGETEIVPKIEKGREQLVNQLIKLKCLPAFQILIQEYQYQFTELNLQYSINTGSLKFINFMLQQQPTFKETIIHSLSTIKLIEIPNFQDVDYSGYPNRYPPPLIYKSKVQKPSLFKSLNWLNNEKIIDINSTNTITGNGGNLLLQIIQSSKIEINETMSVKLLIITCKLILSTTLKSITINDDSIDSFSNSLTKQELKLPLSDKSNQIQFKRDFIIKLINLYYSFCNIESKSEFYYLYFGNIDIDYGQGNDNGNLNKLDEYQERMGINSPLSNIKLSFQFANFELLSHTIRKYLKNDIMSNFTVCVKTESDMLFSHCIGSNSKEKKLKFVNSIIRSRIKKDESDSVIISDVGPFFQLLVGYDDIELIKLYTDAMEYTNDEDLGYNTPNIDYSNTIGFIKSIEMLEFIFKWDKNSLPSSDIWYFKSIELFKHYESLCKTSYTGLNDEGLIMRIQCIPRNLISDLPLVIEIIKLIIKGGPKNFKINQSFVYLVELCNSTPDEKLEIYKSYFLNFIYNTNTSTQTLTFFSSNSIGHGHSISFVKFLNWIFINYKDYLIGSTDGNGEFQKRYIESKNNIIYLKIKKLDLLSLYQDSYLDPLFAEILNHQIYDINTLDFILKELIKLGPQSNSHHIKSILDMSASKGNLMVFQHIFQNYNWILGYSSKRKKKTFTDNEMEIDFISILTTKQQQQQLYSLMELKDLLIHTISRNHLKCAEFLFDILPNPTIKEFESNSGYIAKLYFKNKYTK